MVVMSITACDSEQPPSDFGTRMRGGVCSTASLFVPSLMDVEVVVFGEESGCALPSYQVYSNEVIYVPLWGTPFGEERWGIN